MWLGVTHPCFMNHCAKVVGRAKIKKRYITALASVAVEKERKEKDTDTIKAAMEGGKGIIKVYDSKGEVEKESQEEGDEELPEGHRAHRSERPRRPGAGQ